MNKKILSRILDVCSSLDDVKVDVVKNYENNLWWPLDIDDYRKRLLIAGLSTRISYFMINSYRNVIKNLNYFTYNEIKNMTEKKIVNIIKPLGLNNTRYKYIRSMINFIENNKSNINKLNINKLIELISRNVDGASYKVAQCCVLYMKGYHCGVMPVDSGMKNIFLPCIGFKEYNSAIGHNILRKKLEKLIKGLDLEKIIKKNRYNDLNFNVYTNATWWSHLVLIYFKRHYCNKHKPKNCPLNNILLVKNKCFFNKETNINNL